MTTTMIDGDGDDGDVDESVMDNGDDDNDDMIYTTTILIYNVHDNEVST